MEVIFQDNVNWSKQSLYKGPEAIDKLKWKLPFKDTITQSRPIIDGQGNIYFGTEQGEIHSIDKEGNIKWTRKLGEGTLTSPVLESTGYIYIALRNYEKMNSLLKLDMDGNVQWRYDTMEEGIFAPITLGAHGSVYFATHSSLSKMDTTGRLIWSFPCRNMSSSVLSDSSGNVYFSIRDGKGTVFSLSPEGEIRWIQEIGNSLAVYEPIMDHDENVYFTGSEQNIHSMYSFNKDGEIRWKFTPENRGIISSPALRKDGVIVFGTTYFKIAAIDLSGKLKWETDIGHVTQCTPILDLDRNCYLYTQVTKRKTESYIWRLDPDGEIQWNYKVKGAMDWFHFSPVNGLLTRTMDSDVLLLELTAYEV